MNPQNITLLFLGEKNVTYNGSRQDEDEESSMYYPCKAVVRQGASLETHEQTHVQVSFDHDICSPKILVTDFDTGEILADMLIHTDTEFHVSTHAPSIYRRAIITGGGLLAEFIHIGTTAVTVIVP